MSDLDLLRQYEPIVRMTQGELFLPRAVDSYVGASSLWELTAEKQPVELAPEGELTLDQLATYDTLPPGSLYYLRFVREPLSPLEYQRWLARPDRPVFKAPGRLARVPLISRIGDAFFNLSLLVRGTLPGGTSAAAEIKTRALSQEDDRAVYYGRVVRAGGWIVLHYLYFYTMNNWRSGFYGVNDHEADWEQAFIYLYEQDGVTRPMWVAYAAHDMRGDELRRRWDDPLLVREGDHPVIFAGAGSHGSYFEAGEYMMAIEPAFLTPVKHALNAARKFWTETLRQGDPAAAAQRIEQLISVPFVDYARGDGVSIGPGQPRTWSPVLIDDNTAWVAHYRGLWGLDTQDRFGGERAPSGPKFNRDGSVRMSWYDPLGWAGVDKLFPIGRLAEEVRTRIDEVTADLRQVRDRIETERALLRDIALDVEALKATAYFSSLREDRTRELTVRQADFQALVRRESELAETRLALIDYWGRVQTSDYGPPDAHLRQPHHPAPPVEQHRAIEVWAAVSGALALMTFGYLLVTTPRHWVAWALAVAAAFGAIDALARARVARFLLSVIIALAVVCTIILFIEFWQWIIIGGLIVIVLYMIRDNLRELRA
ncbi:MAG: hypothetical protein K1X50_19845 [Candidatus Promineofilum sp.]|nr:hypothetical protein [Promineifilum sp.]MCW5862916.1 hypothetical protein [Anaerolineae bacterium]